MTDVDRIRMPPAVQVPSHIGQATAVEQARAVAQVSAQYLRAAQAPRNRQAALDEVDDVCGLKALAERAFYAYPRGQGNTVTGPSIHLARELARIWGNVDYGLHELRRDEAEAYSEMQAFATDLQTNVRAVHSFVVPHKRDRKRGEAPEPLIDLRDIYENNANMGSRRVRAQIYAILPKWLTDRAEDACRATLRRDDDGVPLAERVRNMNTLFARNFDVKEAQIVARLGKPVDRWNADDLAQLGIVYKSIERREISPAEAFPSEPVTGDEILRGAAPTRRPGRRGGEQPEPKPGPEGESATGERQEWPPVNGPGAAT